MKALAARLAAEAEGDAETIGNTRPWKETYDMLITEKDAYQIYIQEIEEAVMKVRFMSKLKNMSPLHITMDRKTGKQDELLGYKTGFNPFD